MVREGPLACTCVLQHLTGFVERQPGRTRVECGRVTIAEIAQEVRFDLSRREEFLVGARALFAEAEEFFIQLSIVESGHGAAIESQGAGRRA